MTFTILCGVIHVRQGAVCFDSDLRYPVGDISPQRETKEEGLSFEVECVAQRGHVSGEACLHLASVYSHGAARAPVPQLGGKEDDLSLAT